MKTYLIMLVFLHIKLGEIKPAKLQSLKRKFMEVKSSMLQIK
jgi:hypothetical protein